MANRTVLGVSIAIALLGGAVVWVELQQREAIAEARLLADSAGAVETLSGYDSLSAAYDYLQAAIARLENAPTFPRQSELEELTSLRSQLQVVQQKLEPEKKARQNYQEAITRAMSASQLVQNPPHPPPVWEEAQRKWQQTIAQLESIPQATSSFGEAQEKLTGYRQNLAVVSQYVTRSRQAVELNNRGMVLIQSGDYREAIVNLSQAIELNPALMEAYLNRGFAYAAMDSHQSALSNYTIAIRVNSSSPDPYYFRGEEYLNLGNYEDALNDYNKAIALDPNRANAYLDRGLIHYELGNPKNAADDFTKAAELLKDSEEPAIRQLAFNLARDIRATLEVDPVETEQSATPSSMVPEEIEAEEPDTIIIYRQRRVKASSISPSRVTRSPSSSGSRSSSRSRSRRR
ncbi:MAG: tetratricopeptide repeat protein [Arthrospira sp. PLM2.Bin9]|nr:tetratricopeptide repeat protein [Arthrospira sp. PLM2.Bin9]TVU54432.1 MAG: tetratricopeptide repeat protein [Arthrospira sp. PLM2.Bin9]